MGIFLGVQMKTEVYVVKLLLREARGAVFADAVE